MCIQSVYMYVYLLMIVYFIERFVQQQIPSSFSMITINLLSGTIVADVIQSI